MTRPKALCTRLRSSRTRVLECGNQFSAYIGVGNFDLAKDRISLEGLDRFDRPWFPPTIN